MKMNAYTTLLQLGILMALFCIMAASADERPNPFNRRAQGWTPQALFLYGIMPPPKRQSGGSVSFNNIKRGAWGPRANIMRAWHPERVSRDVRTYVDVDEDDEDKRTGWTSRTRVFGRSDDKRVPEGLLGGYDRLPMLKRMFEELTAEKRDPESPELYTDDLFQE